VDEGEVTPADVAAVVASTPEASGREPGDADAQFAFEMLQRAQGRAARAVGSLMADRRDGRMALPYGFAYGDAVLKRLTAAERKALQLPDAKDLKRRPKRAPREDADPVLTMTTDFPAGFAADVTALAGCQPDAGHLAAALIRYGPEGRPRNAGLIESHLSPSCADASRILLLSTLAPPGETAASRVVVVPLSRDVLTCGADTAVASARRRTPAGALRVGGPIHEPRKIVNVAPIYPEAAKQARVSGMVILEAVISPSGCVSEMKVLKGIPQLNAAAISAVARWRYTPTLLDGRPVPVIMTVTINFRLGQ
jgi:TonB family protein